MHDLSIVAVAFLLALLLVYLPILGFVLWNERTATCQRRHHDHLIPATPRTARR